MPAPQSGQPKKFFRKVTRSDSEQLSLDADMIRLLIAIDETKEIGQIARELKMDAAKLKATLVKLLKIKLVEPVNNHAGPGETRLEPDFLQALQRRLTRSVGPMALLLIEEAVAELRLNVTRISRDQAAELIQRISEEIPDRPNRAEFKKAMLERIRK